MKLLAVASSGFALTRLTLGCLALGCLTLAGLALATPANAETLTVPIYQATRSGTGAQLGTITVSDTKGGASFKLNLHDLPPGAHGFQVHDNANCGPTLLGNLRIPAGAAGYPWDPDDTDRHAGPYGNGHLGDLPVMQVQADGTATQTLVAPRIKDVEDLRGHALVIHVGGDNYKDSPQPEGGMGGRLACGMIQ